MRVAANISYLLIFVFYSFTIAEIIAMEKKRKIEEAEIIMPSEPFAEILATFKETDMPKPAVIAGNVQLVSGDEEQKETVDASAAALSETFKSLIAELGTDLPLPVQLMGNLFTKLVDSLKALNNITAIRPSEYSNAMVKALAPLLSEMSFDQMFGLLYESNRLDIKPLIWYIIALLATEVIRNKNLRELSRLIEILASYKDKSDLTAKMLGAILPGGNLSWKLPIPVAHVTELAVKVVPHKGIIALTATLSRLSVWNLTESVEKMQKELEHAPRISSVRSLDISDDGTKALVLLYDSTLELWNLETAKIIRKLSHDYERTSAALSNDGKFVIANSAKGIDLWNIENGTIKPLMKVSDVELLKFSPDGKYALIGLRDNTLQYIKIDSGEIVKVLKAHASFNLSSAAFSNDGNYVLSGSYDKTAVLWDLTQEARELKPVRTLSGHITLVTSVAISPDNNYALVGSWVADLWDLKSEKHLANYTISGNKVSSVAFSSNGKHAVISSSSAIRSVLPGGVLSKENNLVSLWSLSKEPTLPEAALFIKLNQLGKSKVIKDPYFKKLYETFFGYLEKPESSVTASHLTKISPNSEGG